MRRILLLSFVIFFGSVLSVHAANNDVEVHLQVLGCNNNLMCEPLLGESYGNCPSDCGSTTPPPGPIGPNGGGGGPAGAGTSIAITFFQTLISDTTARLNTRTNIPTNSIISWGETTDFELGSQASVGFNLGHELFLTRLKPNTRYYYKIVHRSELGGIHEFVQQFTTLSAQDTTPPQNIWQIDATYKNDKIEIIWQNPPDIDFQKVIIVRSPQFYPRDPNEGKIIYEGSGKYVFDTNFEIGKTYYYSLFSVDKSGNYSSGGVIKIFIPKTPGGIPTTQPEIPIGGPEYGHLSFRDFSFFQSSKEITVASTTVELQTDGSFIIKLPQGKLPPGEHILLFTARDPLTKKEFSFMMKQSTSTMEYLSSVFFESQEGEYPATISIYDSSHRLMTTIDGFLDFKASGMRQISMIEGFSKLVSFFGAIALLLIVLFVVILWIARLLRML
jgi:hypothetical protein